ncbi:hypothetical protein [Cohnella yongneupensis]|uniref:Phage portal protein n=1 Tax=Cohnella yongneupensis TaxID=425006 RepID=A0ABW0QYX2_9BACL
MNIRVWFGVDVNYDQETLFNKSLDSLLTLYAKALTQYFHLEMINNVSELITVTKTKELDIGRRMFLDWLENAGLIEIKETITYTSVSRDNNIINEIEYEYYLLEDEMVYEPNEIRALLIRVVMGLFPRVKKIAEYEFSSFLVKMVFSTFEPSVAFATRNTWMPKVDSQYDVVYDDKEITRPIRPCA